VALGADRWRIARDVTRRAVVQIGVGVLLGLPFAGVLCYEFLDLTGSGGSVPGAVAMASLLGVSVMLLVLCTACTVPTLRASRIAPVEALRKDG
jgi:ABC-type antimicrobial peptide transport system permease subunit